MPVVVKKLKILCKIFIQSHPDVLKVNLKLVCILNTNGFPFFVIALCAGFDPEFA